jgi:hypothetical protein
VIVIELVLVEEHRPPGGRGGARYVYRDEPGPKQPLVFPEVHLYENDYRRLGKPSKISVIVGSAE